MPTLPSSEWTDSLNRMSVAIERALADLDRHRNQWLEVIDNPSNATAPDQLLIRLEQRVAQWDGKLDAAAALAASVEKQLEDRESAMERWHQVFVRWRDLIQNTEVASSLSSG